MRSDAQLRERWDKLAELNNPKLILIGYWKGGGDPNSDLWPDPHDMVDTSWDVDECQKVIDYLLAGRKIASYRGYTWCRFKCGVANKIKELGSYERTDGVYVWPHGLAHYLIDHDVRLPDEFVQHALTHTPEVPESWNYRTIPNYQTDWWAGFRGSSTEEES